MLELGKEAFDAPALLVGDNIVFPLDFAMPSGRDDRFATLCPDEFTQAVGVVSPVGEHLPGRQAPDQVTCWCHVVLLAGAEDEPHWQAERIDYGVDLGAEPASGAAKSLGLNAPLFTLAPAA